MEAAESSSGMIFREINQENTPHQIHLKNNPKRESVMFERNSSIHKVTKNEHNKENAQVSQMESQMTGENLINKNKRESNLRVSYIKPGDLPEEDENKEITLVRVSLTENKRPSGTENLKSIFSQEPCIKQILQSLPANNCNVSTIYRKENLFSTEVIMETSKGRELLKYVKKNSCLGNEYEIISENLRYNILGNVKTNFWGTIFNIYEKTEEYSDEKLIGTIYYDDEFILAKNTRSIEIYLVSGFGKSALEHHETYEKDSLKKLYEQGDNRVIKLINKKPTLNKYSEYVMDFDVDGVFPSVKNTIMVEEKTGKEAIKFIKVDYDDFKLKVCENMSIFIGYCFALSSLVFKWGCQ